jgi:hypothetical protein
MLTRRKSLKVGGRLMESRSRAKNNSISQMGRQVLIAGLLITAFVALVSNSAQAQSKQHLASISKEQTKQRLKSVINQGGTIFYPEVVPARFSLVGVHISSVVNQGKRSLEYSLEFCDKRRRCFSIQSAYGEIGSAPGGDRSLTGRSKIFGNFRIEHFNPTKNDNHVYYLSEWWEDKKMMSAHKKGIWPSPNGGRYHHFLGYGVSDREALAIVKSLVPLK